METEMVNRNWFKSSIDLNVERFRENGLWFLIRLFHWWGLYLEKDSAVVRKWQVVGLLLVSIISSIAHIFILFYVLMDGAGLLESLSYGMIVSIGFIGSLVIYISAIRNAKHYSLLMRSLASAIHRIPLPEVKKKCARNIHRSLGIGIGFITVALMFFTYSCYGNGSDGLKTNNQSRFNEFIAPVAFLSMTTWLITTGSFYIISHWALKIVCDVIETLIDTYILPEKITRQVKDIWMEHSSPFSETTENELSSLAYKIMFHQKISLIVIEADKFFSNFLFISLCLELLVSVTMIKMMSFRNGQFSNTVQFGFLLMFCIVWKALKCAHINDKLKSSLTLTNSSTSLVELEQCSAIRINYLVYMQERTETKAVFTYGGIFKAKKMFIFTVVGTIISYTLVLNGI